MNGMPKQEKISGRWLRTFRTARLAGSVESRYVGGRLLDAFRSESRHAEAASQRHETNARRILETLQGGSPRVKELDYRQRAANATFLGRWFENDAEIFVPRVHAAFSSGRVLCYDWVEGSDLVSGFDHPQQAQRERLVRQLLRALGHPLFRGGVMHADPHPGNFRRMDDGRLALLDFCCCKVFDESFMEPFTNIVHGELDQDPDAQRRAMAELGLFEGSGSTGELVADAEQLADFFARGLMRDDVNFADNDYVQEARALIGHFVGRGRMPPAHKDFLFLTRVMLGYYYFSRAQIRLNFRAKLVPYIQDGWNGRVVA